MSNKHPTYTVIGQPQNPKNKWLGKIVLFFDNEEDAKDFYNTLHIKDEAIVIRPWHSSDRQYMNPSQLI